MELPVRASFSHAGGACVVPPTKTVEPPAVALARTSIPPFGRRFMPEAVRAAPDVCAGAGDREAFRGRRVGGAAGEAHAADILRQPGRRQRRLHGRNRGCRRRRRRRAGVVPDRERDRERAAAGVDVRSRRRRRARVSRSIPPPPCVVGQIPCGRNRAAGGHRDRCTRDTGIGAAGIGDRSHSEWGRRRFSGRVVSRDDDRVMTAGKGHQDGAAARAVRRQRRQAMVRTHAIDRDGVAGDRRRALTIPRQSRPRLRQRGLGRAAHRQHPTDRGGFSPGEHKSSDLCRRFSDETAEQGRRR